MSQITSLTPAVTGTRDLEPLVKQLARRADVNRDGQVSSEEFAQFLTDQAGQAAASKTAPASIGTIHAAPTEQPMATVLDPLATADLKEIDASAQTAKYRAMALANALIAQMRIVK